MLAVCGPALASPFPVGLGAQPVKPSNGMWAVPALEGQGC